MAIDLGNIIGSGDKTVASGIASGFDSVALVESLVEAKRTPAVQLEEKLTLNADKVTAFGELRTILEGLRTASDFLRDPPGLDNASSNIFEYRSSTLTANTSSTIANLLSITAAPGADIGGYDIAIGNLAEAKSIRTNAFTSKTTSITEAAAGATAEMFSAGTFSFAPPNATSLTITPPTTLTVLPADYTTTGTVSGSVITSSGMHNFADDNSSADETLMGILTGFTSTYDSGADTLAINVTVNGRTYTSNSISTAGGGGSDSIAAGTTITFTNSTTGTSFDLVTGVSDYLINDVGANATQFVTDVEAALSAQRVMQDHELGIFDNDDVTSLLSGLTTTHVNLRSDGYNATTDEHGTMSGFTVTHNGVDDNDISVTIDGETYQATTLIDAYSSVLVLGSTTTDKELRIDLATAGVTLDVSTTQKATDLQNALDYAFGAKQLVDVTISEGDSLVDIMDAINAVKNTSNVEASIIQVGDADFRLTLESTLEGTENAFVIVDDDTVTSDVTFSTVQAAEDASLKVDGITITRSTNSINDIISGVTLNLINETSDFGGGSEEVITVEIQNDTSTASAGIENFINAFNSFRVEADEQQLRDDNAEFREGSVLGRDTTLSTLVNQFNSEITQSVAGVSSTSFTTLSDIGITITDFAGDSETGATNNILTFDANDLTAALANNFANVREIFEFQFNSSSSALSLFKSTNDFNLTDFKVDIDTSRASGNEVRITDSNDVFLFNMTLSGSAGSYKLTGKEDTDLEGLELLYTGDGTDVITASATQGIADRFFNVLDEVLKEDGTLDQVIDTLEEEETRLEADIARIDEQVEKYRTQQLAIFAAMEAAIAQVNTLLDFLESQSDAYSSG